MLRNVLQRQSVWRETWMRSWVASGLGSAVAERVWNRGVAQIAKWGRRELCVRWGCYWAAWLLWGASLLSMRVGRLLCRIFAVHFGQCSRTCGRRWRAVACGMLREFYEVGTRAVKFFECLAQGRR